MIINAVLTRFLKMIVLCGAPNLIPLDFNYFSLHCNSGHP